MSLLECIVFSMGQPNTPESNISGFGRAIKEQARPLFIGIFTHRSDVPFLFYIPYKVTENFYFLRNFLHILLSIILSILKLKYGFLSLNFSAQFFLCWQISEILCLEELTTTVQYTIASHILTGFRAK